MGTEMLLGDFQGPSVLNDLRRETPFISQELKCPVRIMDIYVGVKLQIW